MDKDWIKELTLGNGSVLVSIVGYVGEEDFYGMYDIIKEIIRPESQTFGVDSLAVDGHFVKDDLLVRMSSDGAGDCCCFMYNPTSMTQENAAAVKGWISEIVTEMHARMPR